ncbi:hypothetical protein ACFPES_03295 [Paenibacillus sp. GCM10023248]|uniref:hypothetical protein n=1 Tax=unclassified Paenibacillus TaxID=185978 RepID=UPI0023786DE2|nr:hypothetical protein [Paenibacillus sp. MAHUQ-63]MDD9266051.1 hypothetical protein [Paenibacillus sp. MAHUQ-63]
MANANNNDVVIVELDRPRELRFGHKALKRMLARNGKSVEDMEQENQGTDLDELETIFFYGLEKDARENGEKLTLEMMEDILDYAPSHEYLMEKIYEAFNKAYGKFGGNNLAVDQMKPASREK